MFQKMILNLKSDMFDELSKANNWEQLSNERQGANLMMVQPEGRIPLVRTTTDNYIPSQSFAAVHLMIIKSITDAFVDTIIYFNNAMAEIYDPKYTKMRFHSDQNLDLAPESHICIYSCYEHPGEPHPRRLIVKNKITGEKSEISLEQNSAIIFSVSTNDHHLHKIVGGQEKTESKWLGITFRVSKTMIEKRGDKLFFDKTDRELTKATEEERKEFFRYKQLQNTKVDFVPPNISYALTLVI